MTLALFEREDQNVVIIALPPPHHCTTGDGRLPAPGLYWSVTLCAAFTSILTRDLHDLHDSHDLHDGKDNNGNQYISAWINFVMPVMTVAIC